MQERQFSISYKIYSSEKELSSDDLSLIHAAAKAVESSYAPYSQFYVGAALRMGSGQIITGSNQENASYPLGLCAERTALSAAVAIAPSESIEAIAIKVRSGLKSIAEPAAPCGICRQVLFEAELKHKRDIRIILQGESGPVYVFKTIKDLLPLHFDSSYL